MFVAMSRLRVLGFVLGTNAFARALSTSVTSNVKSRRSLPAPSVVFQDNHLLVVNKPAGWLSVPNPGDFSPKCLLSELKRKKLGGGSLQNFLLPLHRIDQPCTGLLILGKTSKAGTRVTTQWKKKKVQKEYLCVVPSVHLESLRDASTPIAKRPSTPDGDSSKGIYCLPGRILPQLPGKESRSVRIRPESDVATTEGRSVQLHWRQVPSTPINKDHEVALLQVTTTEGSRHMVRALLGSVGKCPICGDLRYGGKPGRERASSLPDRSVALHAYRVSFDPKALKLGSLETFDFHAPLPETWKSFFGIDQSVEKHIT